jgi:hypothetical protein
MNVSRLFRRKDSQPQIPFAEDKEMQRIAPLADEFLKNVLFDEEPLFISDEATIWDVSSGLDANELSERCLKFYGVPLLPSDFKRSLWGLIEYLHRTRKIKSSSY